MKRFLKKLFVPILASRPVASLATRVFGSGIPIFLLHRMAPAGQPGNGRTNAEHLRRCLQYLVDNGYTFVSLEQLVVALRNKDPLPPKAVVFTMDDGYLDQAQIAAPLFIEFECPLTFFVITGMLDGDVWPWDAQVSWIIETASNPLLEVTIAGTPVSFALGTRNEKRLARHSIQNLLRERDAGVVPDIVLQLANSAGVDIPGTPPEAYLPMDWEMARQLETKGVRFAPHSVTHNIMSRVDEVSLKKEITESWATMQKQLRDPLKVFGYPSGRLIDFSNREIRALKDSGYLGAAATTPEFVEPKGISENNVFTLPRFALPESMDDFIQYCSWIEYAKGSRCKSPASK